MKICGAIFMSLISVCWAGTVFREDFQEVPAHIPVISDDLTSGFLGLRLLGPGAGKVKLSFHPEVKNDPHYLWNGQCEGGVLMAFPFEHELDLNDGESKVRLRCKNVGASSLHLAFKISGKWIAKTEGLQEDKGWKVHELVLDEGEWRELDVEKVTFGEVVRPKWSEVDAIGFAAPVTPNKSKDCIRLDWFELESETAKVRRGQKVESLPRRGFLEPTTPFFRSALLIQEGAELNRVRRGVVIPLGRGLWGCFDPDLLRWAAVWKA
ncbi:hypothetical protein N9Z02_00830, partial [Akkermansiaceae bacterium]|nr:hypothetical protein [Akkermansiaceae bacterium]